MASWNFQQTFPILYEWDEDNDDIILAGKSVPDYLRDFLKANIEDLSYEEPILVDVECSGYYDKGSAYGSADNCYPPEGEDERIIWQIWFPENDKVLRDRGTDAERTHFKWIADHIQEYIDNQELYYERYDD